MARPRIGPLVSYRIYLQLCSQFHAPELPTTLPTPRCSSPATPRRSSRGRTSLSMAAWFHSARLGGGKAVEFRAEIARRVSRTKRATQMTPEMPYVFAVQLLLVSRSKPINAYYDERRKIAIKCSLANKKEICRRRGFDFVLRSARRWRILHWPRGCLAVAEASHRDYRHAASRNPSGYRSTAARGDGHGDDHRDRIANMAHPVTHQSRMRPCEHRRPVRTLALQPHHPSCRARRAAKSSPV